MDTYQTEVYKGYTINIVSDENSESPREWDNLGTMYYKHREYTLGDIEIPESFYSDKDGDTIYINTADTFKQYIDETIGEVALMLPLAIYDHSGITMWVGSKWQGIDAQWDCSQVGWIIITKEKIKQEYGVKRISKKLLDSVEKCLKAEVKTFDNYLTGSVYGYQVEETSDSCYGYYGDEGIEDAILEAKSNIDYDIKEKQQRKNEKIKAYIKNKVPLMYR